MESHREKERSEIRVEQKTKIGDGRRRAGIDQNRGKGEQKEILEWKGKTIGKITLHADMENYY